MRPDGHLFLVGFMGSGKSSIGRVLAGILDRPFLDTDLEVERLAGASVASIFENRGERAFRELESHVLQQLPDGPPRVVATGGGTLLRHANRVRLRETGRTLWLDLPLAEIERRLAGEGARPLFRALDPRARQVLFDRRQAVYALADLRVDAARGTPSAVAAEIRRILGY